MVLKVIYDGEKYVVEVLDLNEMIHASSDSPICIVDSEFNQSVVDKGDVEFVGLADM
jgi:hypothetical protein